MIYVKSVLFGIGGAIVAALFWIVVSFVLPMFLPMLVNRMLNRGGASGASITSDSILVAATGRVCRGRMVGTSSIHSDALTGFALRPVRKPFTSSRLSNWYFVPGMHQCRR